MANELLGTLFFLSLLGWALGLMILLPHLRIGAALLCAMCAMLLSSYTGVVLLDRPRPTAYIVLLGGLLCLLYGTVALCANWKNLRKRTLTGSSLFFVLVCAVYAAFTVGMVISDHDALSYWARAVKELYTTDRLYLWTGTTLYHKDYIPLLASLQYCVMRVFGWREAYLSYVTFACLAVSVAALVDLLGKRFWSFVLGLATLYAYSAFGQGYTNLRADMPMCVMFLAGLMCLYAREDNRLPSLLPSLCVAAVLPGMKIYSGLMFALILTLCLLAEALRLRRTKEAAKPLLAAGLIALVGVLYIQLSWSGLYNFATASENAFSLAMLFKGNPRNEGLLQSLTAEKLAGLGDMIAQTGQMYAQSKLPWALAFVAVALTLLPWRDRKRRAPMLRALVALSFTAVVFVLGLFGSYLVQAEVSAASTVYLLDVTVPLFLYALYLTMDALCRKPPRRLTYVVAVLMVGGVVLLSPPATWVSNLLHVFTEPMGASALAQEFYEQTIYGQLTDADDGKSALLIDCSWSASQLTSESGITYGYQYYALPLNVHVYQFPYWEITELDEGTLLQAAQQARCSLLILNIDDDLFWQALLEQGPFSDDASPTGVYDIEYNRDEIVSLALREGA